MVVDTAKQTRQGPPKFINTLLTLCLRSPLHGLASNAIMLLIFRGRKSGKQYTIPVGYTRQGNTIVLFTDHSWWKNLRDEAPVTLRLKGKKLQGRAEIIQENTELVIEGLQTLVRQHPGAARAYGVKLAANKQPEDESLRQAAQRFTMVRIHLR